MCEHLKKLEDYLKQVGVVETWRGQPWTENCREWIYFSCVLEPEALKEKLELDEFITVHEHSDPRSGSEQGLVCEKCDDAIIGIHPESSIALTVPRIG